MSKSNHFASTKLILMSRLPILMYHNVCADLSSAKNLTIAVETLEQHFKFLADNDYKTFHFSELEALKKNKSLPKKSAIITFDDVYVNQLEFAYPLLEKYGLKASFFIPFAYVNGMDLWNTNLENIMSVEQLKSLNSEVVELGLHSFKHKKYNELSNEEVIQDFESCQQFIYEHKLEVHNVLAYPYGKFPRKNPEKFTFFNTLNNFNIAYGLRIGNRVNQFPFKNNYQIQRIDIKGEDTLAKFKLKLRYGKLRLF
ncbi:polysaccharide deacetylase [Ichthyenterobacterium magnum]|uniref:Polysaccharide deacetylase n=2 Tax=Ichthyenterobacterium magnum TaxID=1230530 RepID=A0A420DGZ2_9FLAO|nr:polysaccharide deacetylase [Ichthyenterobacterium magnum]